MLVFSFRSLAQPADDSIVPTNLVASLQPNFRLFFIKLIVMIRSLHPQDGRVTTRHVFQLSGGCDEVSGLDRLTWESIIGLLNQVGSPLGALTETIIRVTTLAQQMVADPSNAGRMVLPMEVFLLLIVDERQIRPVVKVDVEEEGVVCSVCLEDLEVGSKAGRLPCMHLFHEICINPWLTYNHSCPNCRFQLGFD